MNDAVHSEIFFLEDDTLEIKMKHYISPKISVYSTVGKATAHFPCARCIELHWVFVVDFEELKGERGK